MVRSHFLNMVIFSALVSVFFAFLTQNDRRERWKVMTILGLSMVVLSLILAITMNFFSRTAPR